MGMEPKTLTSYDNYMAMASNPKTPDDVLEAMALHIKDVDIRLALARNESLNEETAQRLAEAGNREMCIVLADNPSIPYEAIKWVAEYPHSEVKAAVAYRSHLPDDILDYLMLQDTQVRVSLADNIGIPMRILWQLMDDDDPDVRDTARWHYQEYARPIELNTMPSRDTVRMAQETEDPDELDLLSKNVHSVVRCAVAANNNTRHDTIARLSRDHEVPVRATVLRRKDLDPSIAKQMALLDESESIRANACQSEKVHAAVLAAVATDVRESTTVRLRALKSPRMPSVFLEELESDAEARIAEAARKALRARRSKRAK